MYIKLHTPLFGKFSRHCVLSSELDAELFALMPERRNETINNRVGIEPTTDALQSHPCAPAPRRPQVGNGVFTLGSLCLLCCVRDSA